MKSNLLRTEVLIGALFPVVALLIVGETGINQMTNTDIRFFIFVLILAIILVFIGEIALVTLIQRALKKQYADIVKTCQEYATGNAEARATVIGDTALSTLAHALNTLIEEQSSLNQDHNVTTSRTDEQLQHLVHEITPVLQGDLRIKAEVPQGNIGTVADVCNALVEELTELVRWTRDSAQQVTDVACTLLEHALELAQTTEIQMLRFSQSTESVEILIALLQRLGNNLQLSVDISQEISDYTHPPQSLPESEQAAQREQRALLDRVNNDIERQRQLLSESVQKIQEHATTAESTIEDFYSFAQRIHHSSSGILKAAEQVGALAKLAERWKDSILSFQLPMIRGLLITL